MRLRCKKTTTEPIRWQKSLDENTAKEGGSPCLEKKRKEALRQGLEGRPAHFEFEKINERGGTF